jgi:Dolichyl-phosphate-mannose-protein mannosyltransferase
LLDCTAVMIPLALFLAALAARGLAAAIFADPAYPDSFYYVNVADALATGHGFAIDYVWNFVDVGGHLPADPGLPIPSNAHWMPLASIIQVPFILALGPTALAHGLPFWLIGAAVAPVVYWIGLDAGLGRFASTAAAVLAIAPGALLPFLAQPDNFALFMLLGALALWACARGLRGDRRAFVLGGLVVGLATLSRNDGLLLGIPFALAFLVERWRSIRAGRSGASGGWRAPGLIGWSAALGCLALFLLVMAPWWLRQLAVFGSLSPSASSGRILWITSYDQLWSISGETTLSSFLAQGIGPLLASRLAGLGSALGIFASVPLLIFLAPFTLIAAVVRRRDPAFIPWIVYAVVLFAFSGILFAVHVAQGTFLHSAVALVPHAYLLAVAGIGVAVRWVAARRPSWDGPRATRNFTVILVGVTLMFSALATWRVLGTWSAEEALRRPIAEALADTGPASKGGAPGDVVMSADPGAYRFLAGSPGIVTPNDPLPVVEEAMRAYGVRWLVLERAHTVPAMGPLLLGKTRPAWLSAPVLTSGRVEASPTGGPASDAVVLYAVCLEPGDTRCSP